MEPIYIVLDIRTVEYEGGYAVVLNNTQHHTRQGAESQFYTKLAAAANPDNPNPKRSVVLMTDEGFVIDGKSYAQPEPEPEPEPEEDDSDQEPTVDSEGATDGVSGPYEGMTKAQLLELAQQRGIEAYESWTKAQIIEALTGAE